MQEPHTEGVAIHGVPESCTGGREAEGEALTGARAGEVLSREILDSREPTLFNEAEGHTDGSVMRAAICPSAVGDPLHARNLPAREPGDPALARVRILRGPHREGRRP